jgi:hypothetical protein
MSEENYINEGDKCGAPNLRYMEIVRNRAEVIMRITNGVDKYLSTALWQNVIDSLARGADPLMIIEQLMDINIEQSEQLKKRVISEPVRYEITGEGAKELVKHMSGLKWQPVDPENLPTGEVLARNKTDVLVGVLYKSDQLGVVCDTDEVDLNYVTHYITTENLLKL